MIRNDGNLGLHRLWLAPFEPKVLGGLRTQINQFSDPTGTILTPKRVIRNGDVRSASPFPSSSNFGDTGGEGEVCVPPEIEFINFDPPVPGGGFYEITPPDDGPTLTISTLATGTAPLSYKWYWNGSLISTDPSFVKTLVQDDAVGATAENGWIGGSSILLVVTNACGAAVENGSVPIQLLFPP